MVTEFFAKLTNPIFAPLLALEPHIALLVFSTILTVIIFALNKLLINKKVAKEIKDKLAVVKESLTLAQKEGRKDDISKFMKEYMAINNEHMRLMFKVMIATLAVVIVLFPWASANYSGVTVANLPFSMPFIGANIGWLLWYILISLAGSWVLRKFIGE